MDMTQLKLAPGTWLVSNCGDIPSEKNCKLVMMAPADQKEDLMAAGIDHMVNSHGHQREAAQKLIEEQGDALFQTITVSEAVAA